MRILPVFKKIISCRCRQVLLVRLQCILTSSHKGHDKDLFRKFAVLKSASLPPEVPYPTVVVRLKVDASMANRGGNLHGGCTATIFDDITTLPLVLVAREGAWQLAGVTRTLSVNYLKGVPIGEEVEIIAEVMNAGGRLGLFSISRCRRSCLMCSASSAIIGFHYCPRFRQLTACSKHQRDNAQSQRWCCCGNCRTRQSQHRSSSVEDVGENITATSGACLAAAKIRFYRREFKI